MPQEIYANTTVPMVVPAAASAPQSSSDGIGDPCAAVRDMQAHWSPIQAVLGGTPGMRKLGQSWLPQEKYEKEQSYQSRIDRSILFNMFRDAVEKAVSKPFARPTALTPDESQLPETIAPLATDADRQGHDLTAFARMLFRDAVTWGSAHIIVDVPATGLPDETARRLDVQASLGIRPYFNIIAGPNLIDWLDDEQGNCIIMRVREWHTVRTGWRDERVEHVRVWNASVSMAADDGQSMELPAGWILYRKSGTSNWTEVERGDINYPGPGLPIVSLVLEPCESRIGYPPLEDAAWLTTAHWQSYSDYRNILRFVSIGVLFIQGVSQEEMAGATVIAANHAVRTENTEGKMSYVEHTGAAIGALERCLVAMEQRANVVSMQPLIDSVGTSTATGRSIDDAKAICSLQSWARSTEHSLEQAFAIAARWVGAELPEDFAVDVWSDFGITMRAQQDIAALLTMAAAHDIDHATLLAEMKKRGVLSDTVDIEAEVAKTNDQREQAALRASGLAAMMSEPAAANA